MKTTVKAFLFLCFLAAFAFAEDTTNNLRGGVEEAEDFEDRVLMGGGARCGTRLESSDCDDDKRCKWCSTNKGRKGKIYGGKCITKGERCRD